MKNLKFEIESQNGLHARPSGQIVKEALKFKSDIKIELKRGSEIKTADAKSLFSIMGLGAKKGEVLYITISGEDEEIASRKIYELLKENFA